MKAIEDTTLALKEALHNFSLKEINHGMNISCCPSRN